MMSSTTPSTTMMTAPSRMLCVWGFSRISTNSRMLAIKPAKIARPPSIGPLGEPALCMKYSSASLGTSIAPTLYAKLLTTGVIRKLTTRAVSNASATGAIS